MTNSPDWEMPISLQMPKLSEWPNNIFPEEIQNFINDLSTSTETPIELPTLTVLAVIATASQGKYRVQIKPDYFEPINLWTCVALPPGSRKSAVLGAATGPLIAWERRKKEEMAPAIATAVSEQKTMEARIKELRRQAGSSEKDDFLKLNEEIALLESKLEKVPSIPQIWAADVTPENLGVIMAENDEKMSIISDESGIFDILSGRYSGGIPNLDIFLQSHAGSPVRVNRGNRPHIFMEQPALTLGLTSQPEVLRGITKNPIFRGRGLLGRFLYALPYSNLGLRTLETEPLSNSTREKYFEIINSILDQNPQEGSTIKLSEEAYKEWHAYALVIEIRMGERGIYAHMRDWAGKLPGAIARIAALLHICQHARYDPGVIEVSLADMQAAIKLGLKLAEHAIAVFDLMGADPALDGARVILDWIKQNQLTQFTFRDCHHAHKNRFKRAKDLEPSIEALEERHFIREREKEKRPYRPSRKFDVNITIYTEREKVL